MLLKKSKADGKKISYSQGKKDAEVQKPRGQALFSLWPEKRIYERFRDVQNLFPRIRQRGNDSGN
ncbi:MAG: hypothetical protein A3G59_03630 [Candidatus Taylorbacteria bacterium RIFCSPLOWO2_12_FULL_47_20]|uniref:Uncharacterized protein n=2 Tax=Candidatus Tayloriibacteriota TaxID=1817919 RepID=A0A1G2P568_9BACT|nr:MAG: hypothetical protein A3H68_00055 [Candidatus Taylorbacteria bacterium RIFCSPLOWO2_02_FULL_46_40]OHA43478.1 MAG: hypothetical protein A3G59_03630 [Candidatus Taylorbacteria bacterium RIFCSPLOWO2_12_FULL_47_20]